MLHSLTNRMGLSLFSRDALIRIKSEYPNHWKIWEVLKDAYQSMKLDCYLMPNADFAVISTRKRKNFWQSKPFVVSIHYQPVTNTLHLIYQPQLFIPEELLDRLIELTNLLNPLLRSGQIVIRGKQLDEAHRHITLNVNYSSKIALGVTPTVDLVQSMLADCFTAADILSQAIIMLQNGRTVSETILQLKQVIASFRHTDDTSLGNHPAYEAVLELCKQKGINVSSPQSSYLLPGNTDLPDGIQTTLNLPDNTTVSFNTRLPCHLPEQYRSEILQFITFVNAHFSQGDLLYIDSEMDLVACRTALTLSELRSPVTVDTLEKMLAIHLQTIRLVYPRLQHVLEGKSTHEAMELSLQAEFMADGQEDKFLYFIIAAVELLRAQADLGREIENVSPDIDSFFNIADELSSPDQVAERAKICERLLRTVSPDKQPVVWSKLQYFHGDSLTRITHGDRMENIERAIESFKLALQVQTRDEMPQEWARTMIGLGYAYQNRLRGPREKNIESTILYYEEALTFHDKLFMPTQWADVQHNLGEAYLALVDRDNPEVLEKAVQSFKQAIKMRSEKLAPYKWAQSMTGIGKALMLQSLLLAENTGVQSAFQAYEQALTVLTKETYPLEWATVIYNYGLAYSIHASQIEQSLPPDLLSELVETLPIFSSQTMPREHVKVQLVLGNAYFQQQTWNKSHYAFEAIYKVSQTLVQMSASPEAKQVELKSLNTNLGQHGYSLARLDRLEEAVFYLEAHRTRLLDDALQRLVLDANSLRDTDREAYFQLNARITLLEKESRAIGQPWARDFVTISTELQQVRTGLTELIESISSYRPEFAIRDLGFPDIKDTAIAAGFPIVYVTTTMHGSLALIVLPKQESESVTPVWLDEFREGELNGLLLDRDSHAGYLNHIVSGNASELKQLLQQSWSDLYNKMLLPICQELELAGYFRANLILTGYLSLLPLHAIAPDQFALTLSPSARALQSSLNLSIIRRDVSKRFLGIGNPSSANMSPLEYAANEVRSISSLFSVDESTCFVENGCTIDALKSATENYSYLHFACHGAFSVADPLSSSLYLTGEDLLTLRNLLDQELELDNIRLVVLSACQTGLVDFTELPEESIGFPAGLLQAGIPVIISTLWPISDLSTMLLMERFYQFHLVHNLGLALALRQAQLWLRDVTAGELTERFGEERMKLKGNRLTLAEAGDYWRRFAAMEPEERPFSHPYYWAAFTFTGA